MAIILKDVKDLDKIETIVSNSNLTEYEIKDALSDVILLTQEIEAVSKDVEKRLKKVQSTLSAYMRKAM
jgi:vacuolar-type H+-ATPase subunit I/STV1